MLPAATSPPGASSVDRPERRVRGERDLEPGQRGVGLRRADVARDDDQRRVGAAAGEAAVERQEPRLGERVVRQRAERRRCRCAGRAPAGRAASRTRRSRPARSPAGVRRRRPRGSRTCSPPVCSRPKNGQPQRVDPVAEQREHRRSSVSAATTVTIPTRIAPNARLRRIVSGTAGARTARRRTSCR